MELLNKTMGDTDDLKASSVEGTQPEPVPGRLRTWVVTTTFKRGPLMLHIAQLLLLCICLYRKKRASSPYRYSFRSAFESCAWLFCMPVLQRAPARLFPNWALIAAPRAGAFGFKRLKLTFWGAQNP